jgi:hypothetical protein
LKVQNALIFLTKNGGDEPPSFRPAGHPLSQMGVAVKNFIGYISIFKIFEV